MTSRSLCRLLPKANLLIYEFHFDFSLKTAAALTNTIKPDEHETTERDIEVPEADGDFLPLIVAVFFKSTASRSN